MSRHARGPDGDWLKLQKLHDLDPDAYAAAIIRASALTGHTYATGELEAIAAAERELEKAGLGCDFARFIDGSVVRWRLRILTPRGAIEFVLDDPHDWKRELIEAGLL